MKKMLLFTILLFCVLMCKKQTDLKKYTDNSISASVKTDSLQKYFYDAGIKGSITIYDYKNNIWIYSDKEDSEKQTLPASTFKIPNTLIALEERVIEDENEILKWDGVTREIAAHNADTDLKNAYKNSTVWFYQKLAEKIGADQYKKYLNNFHYGNENLSGNPSYFWLDNTLRISPVEQIEFLKGLYDETFILSKRTYNITKDIMVEKKTSSYTLRSKTGYGTDGNRNFGWYVGYIETTDNIYFFATRLWKEKSEKNENFLDLRKNITFDTLDNLNLIKK